MGDIVRNAATEPEMWNLAALAKLAAVAEVTGA